MVEEIHLEGGTILGTSRAEPNVTEIVKRLGEGTAGELGRLLWRMARPRRGRHGLGPELACTQACCCEQRSPPAGAACSALCPALLRAL